MADAPKTPSAPAKPPGPGVINSPADTAVKEDQNLTNEEVKSLKGDLKPGELGWVELDDEGHPTSAATREPPPPGKSAARVIAVGPVEHPEMLTPSGAPITKSMNPEPSLWDEGMLQRNPPGGTPQKPANPDKHGIGPHSKEERYEKKAEEAKRDK